MNPNNKGKPFGIIKFATDITAKKLANADMAGQIDAIGKSQAVIQFNLDGGIVAANPNFLKAVAYTLGEIKGRHHSMFVSPAERDSPAYREFWAALDAIKKAIQDVGEYVTSTAAAVEQQSTVTSEMSSSMQRAAAEAMALATG